MLSKASGKIVAGLPQRPPKAKLPLIARSLSQWAVVDPGDRVLDMDCGDGMLLSYFGQQVPCSLCGMAASVEQYRLLREKLPKADIMYAQPEDIPWHDSSFDVILCTLPLPHTPEPGKLLKEAMRVLRPGGQILLAMPCYPALLQRVIARLTGSGDAKSPPAGGREGMLAVFDSLGFEKTSWRMCGGRVGVAIGWKAMEE